MEGLIVFARWFQCAPHLTHAFFGKPEITPKQNLDRFSRFCIAHGRRSLNFTMGRPFDLKTALLHGGSGPPSNMWFLGLTRVHNLNGILIGSAIFAWLTIVTDRSHYSICNNRLHLCTIMTMML